MCYLFNGLDVDLSGLSHRLIQHCVFFSVCFQCVCVCVCSCMDAYTVSDISSLWSLH